MTNSNCFYETLAEIQNDKLFYLLLSGRTYREIGMECRCKYNSFSYSTNKVIYFFRKIREQFGLHNRRQLAVFVIEHDLINKKQLRSYL